MSYIVVRLDAYNEFSWSFDTETEARRHYDGLRRIASGGRLFLAKVLDETTGARERARMSEDQ